MKGFKLKLSEALGFHGLTAKLVEEEMNDKGHNRASEKELVKVRETERKEDRGERDLVNFERVSHLVERGSASDSPLLLTPTLPALA